MKFPHDLLADEFLLMEGREAARLRGALQQFSEGGDEAALKATLARWASAPLQAAAGQQSGATAVIPLAGPIMPRSNFLTEIGFGTGLDAFMGALGQADADSSITSILILADTPGGQIYGIPEGAARLRDIAARKPVGVHIMGMNASAGYWLTSAARFIAGGETADVGAIGVYVVYLDLSAALEMEGIKPTVISAGKHKAEGLAGMPLSDEAMTALKARVEVAYAMFVRDVAKGRGVTPSAVRDGFGEGRLLMGNEAKKAGLIDHVDTLESSISRLAGRKSAGAMRAENDEPQLSDSAKVYIREAVIEEIAAQLAPPPVLSESEVVLVETRPLPQGAELDALAQAIESGDDDIRRRRLRLI